MKIVGMKSATFIPIWMKVYLTKGRDAAGLGHGRKDVHDKMGPLRAAGCAPRTRGRKTESGVRLEWPGAGAQTL